MLATSRIVGISAALLLIPITREPSALIGCAFAILFKVQCVLVRGTQPEPVVHHSVPFVKVLTSPTFVASAPAMIIVVSAAIVLAGPSSMGALCPVSGFSCELFPKFRTLGNWVAVSPIIRVVFCNQLSLCCRYRWRSMHAQLLRDRRALSARAYSMYGLLACES